MGFVKTVEEISEKYQLNGEFYDAEVLTVFFETKPEVVERLLPPIDLYLFFFKFTPSIRGIFSLNDELVRDSDPNSAWTGNIAKMSSRGVFVNFTFQ